MAELIGALDQGTTSSRFMIFDAAGQELGRHQLEHSQLLPRAGWVEHDPVQIWQACAETVQTVLHRLGRSAADLAAVGIANQRETTLVWERRTGRPYANAIVWQDTRTAPLVARMAADGSAALVTERTGLPVSTYFSAGKLRWLLEHVAGLRSAAEAGEALFGTVDSWLVWNLTGGPAGGVHVTDVTNASRTMLMALSTLDWDDELLELFAVPRAMLPRILPSAGEFGQSGPDGPFAGRVLVGGVLGDQQAATVGQVCFAPGEVKNTYGTGSFLLLNTGPAPVRSAHGLLTTVAYQLGAAPAVFALEGSIAVTGSAVQWLRDQLGVIGDAAASEELAARVPDAGGMYFVPAFSGLFAPYWRPDARGAMVGLTRFHTAAHLARATLEAICYQTADVVAAMHADIGREIGRLRVDGGVTANALCMQLQADILGIPVSRPATAETTALGAAYAAGLTAGVWADTAELRANWREGACWEPGWTAERREAGRRGWARAVSRSLDWVERD